MNPSLAIRDRTDSTNWSHDTVTSISHLSLGGADQRAEIVIPVDGFVLEANASARRVIVFDLRSPQWLTPTALQAGTVEDAALQAAITANTRLEPR